jgi:hypothetical protein
MRNQICQINKWRISRNKNKMIKLEELRKLIAQDDNRLANIITKRVVNLREIRFYWMKCRFELEAMMKNLNCSHVFFICNAIDMQWHDLYKHMSDFELFQKNTNTKRERLFHRFLQKNSHIATKYLDRRFQLFFKHVLKKKFVVVNYWYRFEWQTRENDHVHDFFFDFRMLHLSSNSKNFSSFEILEQRLSIQLKKFHSLLYIHVANHSRREITLFVNWRSCWIEFKDIQNVSQHTVYERLKTRRMQKSKTRRMNN